MSAYSRRSFMTAGSAFGLGLATVGIFPNDSRAAYQCTPYQGTGYGPVRRCEVGIPIGSFTAAQDCPQWCWAACIEAAFDLAGYKVEQPVIVQKVFGSGFVCAPAVSPQIAYATHGIWVDAYGQQFSATLDVILDASFGYSQSFPLTRASNYLADNIPLIVGAGSHATLMTAMDWDEGPGIGQVLQNITVRDPWPYSRNRRRLRNDEFSQLHLLAAVLTS